MRGSNFNQGYNNKPRYNAGCSNNNTSAENVNDAKANFCIVCKKEASSRCQRCGDFYCSESCQRSDWQNHRYICFPMPLLIRNDQYPGDRPLQLIAVTKDNIICDSQPKESNQVSGSKFFQKPQPKMEHIAPEATDPVIILEFHSTNRCFVRSVSKAANDHYSSIQLKLSAYGPFARRLQQVPTSMSYALVNYKSTWYRVQILQTREKEARVHFCDTGVSTIYNLADIYEITDELILLPCYVVMVQLKNVPHILLNENMKEWQATIKKETYKMEIFRPLLIGYVAVLRNFKTGRDICEEFNTLFGPKVQSNVKAYNEGNQKNVKGVRIEPLKDTASENSSVASKKLDKSVQSQSSVVSNERAQERKEPPIEAAKETAVASTKKPEKSLNGRSPVLNPPFEFPSFDETLRDEEILVLDRSDLSEGCIGLIQTSNLVTLCLIEKYLSKLTDDQPYTPQCLEYCLAKFDGGWYRAKVTEVMDNNHFKVVYIDFTNECTVSSNEIRRYPLDLKYDCLGFIGLIQDFPSVPSEEQLNLLKVLIPDEAVLRIERAKQLETGVLAIYLPEVVKQLSEV